MNSRFNLASPSAERNVWRGFKTARGKVQVLAKTTIEIASGVVLLLLPRLRTRRCSLFTHPGVRTWFDLVTSRDRVVNGRIVCAPPPSIEGNVWR